MDAAALFDGLVKVGGKIDNLWSMYIGVLLAVFWMILTLERPLFFFERVAAWVAYSVFSYINGKSLIRSYELLDTLRVELTETAGPQLAKHPLLYQQIAEADFSDRTYLIFATHGTAWLGVGFILLVQPMFIRRYIRQHESFG